MLAVKLQVDFCASLFLLVNTIRYLIKVFKNSQKLLIMKPFSEILNRPATNFPLFSQE